MLATRARPTHVLQDPERPSRTLTLDFDAFVGRLISLGEPDQEQQLDDYMAAMDLIGAMDSETDDFGRAAPGVGREANFAEHVAALTDEAFEAAWTLLNEADQYHDANRSLTPQSVLARAVYEQALDEDLYPAIARTLLASLVECDPHVSDEFV